MKSIIPSLTFNGNALEAVHFYQDTFRDAELKLLQMHDEESHMSGQVMQAVLSVQGQMIQLNDNQIPNEFKFTPSMSFLIDTFTLDEAENYYRKLKRNGAILVPFDDYGSRDYFGWVQDQYGVCWQINFRQ
ncbi:VOC family protein [Corticicoccus populi]|uniref:VOC family protein n=1 Tax=Corticicoccus populi TaxID=1812821 RepID=A0ABW5WZM6_9STAP